MGRNGQIRFVFQNNIIKLFEKLAIMWRSKLNAFKYQMIQCNYQLQISVAFRQIDEIIVHFTFLIWKSTEKLSNSPDKDWLNICAFCSNPSVNFINELIAHMCKSRQQQKKNNYVMYFRWFRSRSTCVFVSSRQNYWLGFKNNFCVSVLAPIHIINISLYQLIEKFARFSSVRFCSVFFFVVHMEFIIKCTFILN